MTELATTPQFRISGAQIQGIQKVVPRQDIPAAPAQPCISITYAPKPRLESPRTECEIDSPLKNLYAEVHLMCDPSRKGIKVTKVRTLEPVPTKHSSSPQKRKSSLLSVNRQSSSA